MQAARFAVGGAVMGLYDSVCIEEHKCPNCGATLDGELQTKGLGCTMSQWVFPDYIAEVDPEEVRKIKLFDYCNGCRWGGDWTGYIRNQILHTLVPPVEEWEARTIEPSGMLKSVLIDRQEIKARSFTRRRFSQGLAVFIWKHHPELRNNLLDMLESYDVVTREYFERYTLSQCLNPLHGARGIIDGPQNYYWKLIGKTREEMEEETRLVKELLAKFPPGPIRSEIFRATELTVEHMRLYLTAEKAPLTWEEVPLA